MQVVGRKYFREKMLIISLGVSPARFYYRFDPFISRYVQKNHIKIGSLLMMLILLVIYIQYSKRVQNNLQLRR